MFVEQMLNTDGVLFWNSLPNLKIKTLNTLAKKKKVKTSDQKVITVATDRELFGNLVIAAQSRDINLNDVLSYKLLTFPYSLAQSDGSLWKTSKNMLLSELENMVDVQAKLPPLIQGITTARDWCHGHSAHVTDLWCVQLGELAARNYDLIVVPLDRNGYIRVDVVFDRYTSKSKLENKQTGTTHCLRDPDLRPSYISSQAVVKIHNQSSKQDKSVCIPGRNMVQHRGRETTNGSADCSRWWLQGRSGGSQGDQRTLWGLDTSEIRPWASRHLTAVTCTTCSTWSQKKCDPITRQWCSCTVCYTLQQSELS